MINLPETIPEFAIKHLIEKCLLPPRPGGEGGWLMETNAGSARLGSLRESGLEFRGAPRLAWFLVSLEFPPLRRVWRGH